MQKDKNTERHKFRKTEIQKTGMQKTERKEDRKIERQKDERQKVIWTSTLHVRLKRAICD
jgi:hypothetical protein